jgi:hypothetical protein
LSALITASLTPSVIGDRPSHPIYGDSPPGCPVERSSTVFSGIKQYAAVRNILDYSR